VPTPSPALLQVWALWPLGVNIHSTPDESAATVTTAVPQGTQLEVDRSQTLAGKTWLKVHTQDQPPIEGWVLDDPDLLIHRSVSLHIDSDQSWSMLYPATWNVTAPGAAAGVTTLTGDGITMTVAVQAATPKFTPPGPDQQDSEVELYGKTTVMSVYRASAGGYAIVVRVRWDSGRYFTLTYDEPAAAAPDTALFLQLLAGIKVDTAGGAPPPG
jgi:hypothetical protein